MTMKQPVNQHKRIAMGGNARGYKMGGSIEKAPALLKTGTPRSPITKAKMGNGIPGMKKGGNVKGGKC
jgi:hypothetical protein